MHIHAGTYTGCRYAPCYRRLQEERTGFLPPRQLTREESYLEGKGRVMYVVIDDVDVNVLDTNLQSVHYSRLDSLKKRIDR